MSSSLSLGVAGRIEQYIACLGELPVVLGSSLSLGVAGRIEQYIACLRELPVLLSSSLSQRRTETSLDVPYWTCFATITI